MRDTVAFLFFIPNDRKGVAKRDLSRFLQKLVASKIKIGAISACGDRGRFKIYCVPEDRAKFRGFLKSARIRARQRAAILYQDADVRHCLSVIDKIALSGFDITAFDAVAAGKRARALTWSDKLSQ